MKPKLVCALVLCCTVIISLERAKAAGGPPCQVVIDATRVVRKLPSNPAGFCMSFLTDGEHPGQKPFADVLAPMHPGSLRYPMGTLAENYLFDDPTAAEPSQGHLRPRVINQTKPPAGWDWAVRPDGTFAPEVLNFDQFMEICHKTAAEPVVLVATYGHLYPKAAIDEKGLIRNAEQWVRYANVKCHYGVRYWEIGNEVDLKEAQAVMPMEQYLRIYRELATRMKAADPGIRTGLGISHTPAYVKAALQQFPDLVDFVVAHQYGGKVKNYEEYVPRTQTLISAVRVILRSIDESAPAQRRGQTEVLVTEYSSYVGKTTEPKRKLNDIFNALLTFEMTAEMVSADPRVRFTHFWVTHNPWSKHQSKANDVAFAPDNSVLPQGRAVEMMSRFLGDRLVQVQTSTPALHAWASVSKSGAATVWLLNRDSKSVSASLTLKGMPSIAVLKNWALRGKSPHDTDPYFGQAGQTRLVHNTATLIVPPLSVLVLYAERTE